MDVRYNRAKKNSSIFKRSIIALVSAASALFLTISLFTFSNRDISLFYSTTNDAAVTNKCGMIGAYVAGILVYLCGSAALLLPIIIIFFAWLSLSQASWKDEWDRVLASIFVIPICSSLLALYHLDLLSNQAPGGISGFVIMRSMRYLFDTVGSLLVLHTLLCVCCILIFRCSIFSMIDVALAFVQRAKVVTTCATYIHAALRIVYSYAHACMQRAYQFMHTTIYGTHIEQESIFEYENALPHNEQVTKVHTDNFWHEVGIQVVQQQVPQQDIQAAVATEPQHIATEPTQPQAPEYHLPQDTLFENREIKAEDKKVVDELKERARILESKLERFGVKGDVVAIKPGPVVTLFEYEPAVDTKISKIIALEDDLAMALQALSIRIIAPIPGTAVVGFEVANAVRKSVYLSSVIQSQEFKNFSGKLPLILGQDTVGNKVIVDLIKMPHLLIAGSTGSGKSVALNAMLVSLLCRKDPDDLKLILIDPKRLEFAAYADIAHLIFPIITDPRKATPVLRWVVSTMEQRYEKMAQHGVRNIVDYKNNVAPTNEDKMPYIVVVIDELADLMMTAGKDVEDLITRLSQMARAAGIHLIVATQRPSVDVITGLIKVNFPSRISFRVTSKIDSRTILDCVGADKLLGRGDMLFLDASASALQRVHGAYVTDKEIISLVNHIRAERPCQYLNLDVEITQHEDMLMENDDVLYKDIIAFLNEVDEISISMLQRRFRIGYNRSARIIEVLESQGKIMPADGGKLRKVIRS